MIDPDSDQLVATVSTGVQPADVSADAESVWVANRGDDTVSRIDPETNAVVRTTPTASVGGMAAGAGAVWIGEGRGVRLLRLDPALGSLRSIRLAPGPEVFDLALYPVAADDRSVWVGRSAGGVARVDPDAERVDARVALGNSPNSIAIGEGGVWVTDDVDNTVSRIDPGGTHTVSGTTPVGQEPASVAAGEGAVWVANSLDGTVSRVDPETTAVTDTIAVGGRPTGIAVGEAAVWVANSLDGTVSRIDPESSQVAATIAVGEAPEDVTVAHDRVWVSVQPSAAPLEPSATAASEDVARVLTSDSGPIDPALTGGFDDYHRANLTCALLYNYPDRPYPVGARLEPEVATGPPSVSAGGRVYTFELRDDFRFSPPSDEPVTATAFERAIERGLEPEMGSYAAELAKDIVGAQKFASGETPDIAGVVAQGKTLRIELERPAANLVERLATPWFCAVPPDAPVDPEGVDLLPSAGPYYVDSYVPDRSIVLRRNPNYAGARPSEIAEIRFELGVSLERGVERVEAGEADYVILDPLDGTPPPPDLYRRLASSYGPRSEAARAGHQQLLTQPAPILYYFVFNPNRGPFTDPRLRQAVNYAIDRRALAANTGIGQRGRPTEQYIPPGMPGFEDEAIYPVAGADVARARELAGDERRRATLYTCDFPECTRHAAILRSNLRAIGIELDVRQFPVGEFFERVQTPDEPWDLTYWNWIFDYADPATFINDQFAEGMQPLSQAVTDPELERRMAAAARLTGDERLRAYARLDRDLAVEAAPAAPFASGTITHLISARMGCPVLHPIYGLDLAALCIRDED